MCVGCDTYVRAGPRVVARAGKPGARVLKRPGSKADAWTTPSRGVRSGLDERSADRAHAHTMGRTIIRKKEPIYRRVVRRRRNSGAGRTRRRTNGGQQMMPMSATPSYPVGGADSISVAATQLLSTAVEPEPTTTPAPPFTGGGGGRLLLPPLAGGVSPWRTTHWQLASGDTWVMSLV